MSIVELPGSASAGALVRTPPQDLAAEQSVLGGMLLSKDAIADVSEIVRGVDFYRPAHEVIHDAIIDLYGRGEPADPVTVAAELQRRGELVRIGGAPYLHTLSANVPIAANAAYYSEIVRERAILRRLVDDEQRSVVIVTHDMGLAARTDRRIHIVDGKIASDAQNMHEAAAGYAGPLPRAGNSVASPG